MADVCDIERCYNKGVYPLESASDYVLCAKHEHEWRNTGKRLRSNPKKHSLKLIEISIADGY